MFNNIHLIHSIIFIYSFHIMSIDYESLIFYLKPRKKKNISSSTKKEYTLF